MRRTGIVLVVDGSDTTAAPIHSCSLGGGGSEGALLPPGLEVRIADRLVTPALIHEGLLGRRTGRRPDLGRIDTFFGGGHYGHSLSSETGGTGGRCYPVWAA